MGSLYDDFPETAVLLPVKAIVHPTEERVFGAWYDARTRDWPARGERPRLVAPLSCWGPKPEVEIAEFRTCTVFDSRKACRAFAAGDAMTARRCAFLLACRHGKLEIELELTRSRIEVWNSRLAVPPGRPHSTTTTTASRPSVSRQTPGAVGMKPGVISRAPETSSEGRPKGMSSPSTITSAGSIAALDHVPQFAPAVGCRSRSRRSILSPTTERRRCAAGRPGRSPALRESPRCGERRP